MKALLLAALATTCAAPRVAPVRNQGPVTPAAPIALRWDTDPDHAFLRAQRERRTVLLHVVATWSVPSDQMTRTFRDPRVARAIAARDYLPVELDVSDGSDVHDALKTRLRIETIPHVALIGPDGEVIRRLKRHVEVDELLAFLELRD